MLACERCYAVVLATGSRLSDSAGVCNELRLSADLIAEKAQTLKRVSSSSDTIDRSSKRQAQIDAGNELSRAETHFQTVASRIANISGAERWLIFSTILQKSEATHSSVLSELAARSHLLTSTERDDLQPQIFAKSRELSELGRRNFIVGLSHKLRTMLVTKRPGTEISAFRVTTRHLIDTLAKVESPRNFLEAVTQLHPLTAALDRPARNIGEKPYLEAHLDRAIDAYFRNMPDQDRYRFVSDEADELQSLAQKAVVHDEAMTVRMTTAQLIKAIKSLDDPHSFVAAVDKLQALTVPLDQQTRDAHQRPYLESKLTANMKQSPAARTIFPPDGPHIWRETTPQAVGYGHPMAEPEWRSLLVYQRDPNLWAVPPNIASVSKSRELESLEQKAASARAELPKLKISMEASQAHKQQALKKRFISATKREKASEAAALAVKQHDSMKARAESLDVEFKAARADLRILKAYRNQILTRLLMGVDKNALAPGVNADQLRLAELAESMEEHAASNWSISRSLPHPIELRIGTEQPA